VITTDGTQEGAPALAVLPPVVVEPALNHQHLREAKKMLSKGLLEEGWISERFRPYCHNNLNLLSSHYRVHQPFTR
jgi:hypothetical protein